VLTAIACAGLATTSHADDAATDKQLATVQVVGTAPLPGVGTRIDKVPANVQTFSGDDLSQRSQNTVGDFLERQAAGVTISQAQGNPYQPDVSFRGFTASPVLGTPQGLSVFMDGVRINEPFGDIVNWDLIPPGAIAGLQIMPGSNPVFGLNTLGGALAVYTKDGNHYHGGELELSGGSFGRRTLQAQYGDSNETMDYYLAAHGGDDGGWAQHNASRIRTAFGKFGWSGESDSLHLVVDLADNVLNGVQAIPLSFSSDIRQPYTWPDRNRNRLSFVNLQESHAFNERLTLDGNLYYRQYRNENFSSNVNNDYGQIDSGSGLPNTVQGNNTRSDIEQESYGGALQLSAKNRLGQHANQLTVGASADIGRAGFIQANQDAAFTADRGTVGLGDYTQTTNALTRNRYYGLYVSDVLDLRPDLALTASGRYDRAEIEIADRSGNSPLLNGQHTYQRFNPALGLSYRPRETTTVYATYSEGMRAPTPIELACADPNVPCSLPNDFLADPELKKIVSHTYETGARGLIGAFTRWSAALFRTDLDNDIEFISSGGTAVNSGYFQNVGKTRRQGLELSGATSIGKLTFNASYSFIDASYRTGFRANSPSNSSADASGTIQVKPGDRMPGIPRHTLKLGVDYRITPRWEVGSSALLRSGVYARGDENNQDAHGQVPGYAVFNLDLHYRPTRTLELFAQVDNLFDRQYASFGILGANAFNGPGRSFDGANPVNEQFRGYGAPRGVWLGVKYRFIPY
jgi:outer membrane receptor protein involved in Fe transport